MSFVMTDEFSVMVRKINSRIGFSWTHSLPFCFWPIFNSVNIAMLTKGYTPNKFESHNSLKLSFLNIWGLHWNFFNVNIFLNETFLIFLLYVRQTWMTTLIMFLCQGLSPFNPKDCYLHAWSCSICEGRNSFCTRLIWILIYVFD